MMLLPNLLASDGYPPDLTRYHITMQALTRMQRFGKDHDCSMKTTLTCEWPVLGFEQVLMSDKLSSYRNCTSDSCYCRDDMDDTDLACFTASKS